MGYFQEIMDIFFFQIIQSGEIGFVDKGDFGLRRQEIPKIFWQIDDVDKISLAKDGGAL